jgi:hypothetical protein
MGRVFQWEFSLSLCNAGQRANAAHQAAVQYFSHDHGLFRLYNKSF